jgi:hypothetical protein
VSRHGPTQAHDGPDFGKFSTGENFMFSTPP